MIRVSILFSACALVWIFGFPAQACPDFSGKFSCQSEGRTYPLAIDSVTNQEGKRIGYRVLSEKKVSSLKIADNSPRFYRSLYGLKDVTWTGKCERDLFTEKMSALLKGADEPIHRTITWENDDGKLILNVAYRDGRVITRRLKTVCSQIL